MYLSCDLCDEGIDFENEHVCDKEKIKRKMKYLKEYEKKARRDLERIRNAIQVILSAMPMELEKQDNVVVASDKLRELWNAAELISRHANNADDFSHQWMATHLVLCDAFSLFRGKGGRHLRIDGGILAPRPTETIREKLQLLFQTCLEANEALGYKEGFRLSHEDVIERAKNET